MTDKTIIQKNQDKNWIRYIQKQWEMNLKTDQKQKDP